MGKRVGLIGFGFIGANVYRRIASDPGLGLEIAFVHTRNRDRLAEVPATLVLDDLADFDRCGADLVVEMAHPDISYRFGAAFLARTDYMIASVSALGDAALEAQLLDAAKASGRRLFIPHGALVGVDNLYEWRDYWEDVTITFRKHPDSIDFSESGMTPPAGDKVSVVYDGSVRGITRLFPRNINTMATCALATVGLDKCRAVLIADPALKDARAEVVALGRDGSRLESVRVQPMIGVSGTEMAESQLQSIIDATNVRTGLAFV